MVTFICPLCGEERSGKRERCYPCTKTKLTPESREKIRESLTGVKHNEERRRNISKGKKLAIANGGNVFDLAAHMRTRPHPFAVPAGTERIVKDGRMSVKCEDGKWRYRSRLVWTAANGPIPPGGIIHHVNEKPLDDRLENLQLVSRAEHARIHSTPAIARERQLLAVEARKRNGTY